MSAAKQKPTAAWLCVQRGAWRCGQCDGEIGATMDKGYINVSLPKACKHGGACRYDAESMLTDPPEGRA